MYSTSGSCLRWVGFLGYAGGLKASAVREESDFASTTGAAIRANEVALMAMEAKGGGGGADSARLATCHRDCFCSLVRRCLGYYIVTSNETSGMCLRPCGCGDASPPDMCITYSKSAVVLTYCCAGRETGGPG